MQQGVALFWRMWCSGELLLRHVLHPNLLGRADGAQQVAFAASRRQAQTLEGGTSGTSRPASLPCMLASSHSSSCTCILCCAASHWRAVPAASGRRWPSCCRLSASATAPASPASTRRSRLRSLTTAARWAGIQDGWQLLLGERSGGGCLPPRAHRTATALAAVLALPYHLAAC